MNSYKLFFNCPECEYTSRVIVPADIDHHDLAYRCAECHFEANWQQVMTYLPTGYCTEDMYDEEGYLKIVFYSRGFWWWLDEAYVVCGPFFYESDCRKAADAYWKQIPEELPTEGGLSGWYSREQWQWWQDKVYEIAGPYSHKQKGDY